MTQKIVTDIAIAVIDELFLFCFWLIRCEHGIDFKF